MSKKPNIVFLFADDQRFDTINALGNKEIITPNLDKLVHEGVSFTNMHIPSGTSGAVCMPSRAMLNTGRTLFHIKREGQEIDEGHTMLGETLQKAGYSTFGTGKWHNSPRAYARSFTHGSEIFFGGMQDHWNVPAHDFDPTGEYSSRTYKVNNCMLDNKCSEFVSDHVVAGKHSSELFIDATIDFINNHDGENPFYSYVSFMAPHDPRSMPKEFMDMYDIDKIELPKNFASYHNIEYANTECRDELLAPYPRTPEDTKRQIAEYFAMITHIDYQVGKIVKALEDKGIIDDTIIIYAADNGLAMGQHGLFGKQNHFEHSIRVPFIISGKNIPKDEIRDSYAYVLDIFPTICDMIDVDIPATVEGKSFYKTICNKEDITRETLFFAYIDKIRSVKNDRYKLMEVVHDGLITTRLYDIIDDPWELADLSQLDKYQELIKELRCKILEYKELWDDETHQFGKSYWSQYNKISNNC